MYDSTSFELCTMYNSLGVYLRLLWTIYMDKLNRCHVIVFHSFLFLFTDFWQKSSGFWQNSTENRHADFWEKITDLSVKSAD
jgi:hypothetical protein